MDEWKPWKFFFVLLRKDYSSRSFIVMLIKMIFLIK